MKNLRPSLIAAVWLCWLPLAAAQPQGQSSELEADRIEPFQVFDNLYYIGSRSTASWLLVTDQGLIVFEAMSDELAPLALESIATLGFDPNSIRYLIVSHAHAEHAGGISEFQRRAGAVTMMTEEAWQRAMTPGPARDFPEPIRHLSVATGDVINLGRTRVRFMQTPGHTPGVLSSFFTVYDDGYPHSAFLFGGAGLDFVGAAATETYIDTIQRIQGIGEIEVNVPNHPEFGDLFARYERLQQRQEGDDHPFVDPQGWNAWLADLLAVAQDKLAEEQAGGQ